ncbi:MAG: TatD family hydrolase [Bacilli bacterium]|jgi:TatD DNase family protein
MLIDTHCHLDEEQYETLDVLMGKIASSQVKAIIVSGYDTKSSNEAIALAHKYNNVYATVGFHPCDSGLISESEYSNFDKWLKDDKVVAVGEIGLDYYHSEINKNDQILKFKTQINIALKYKKPVIIHNRNASDDVYDILKNSKVKGVIHCFSDDLIMAQKFISLGFMLGIGGIVTFKNSNLKVVLKDIPLDYIILETDSPYLSPEPFRGKQNNPLNLPIIAASIADIKGIEYSELAEATFLNTERLFDLKINI